jgi:hypothetical protein
MSQSSVKRRAVKVFPLSLPFSREAGPCYIGAGKPMIYFIYKDGEILVETDDIEFVKDYIKTEPECSVRDARTGKKIPLE